MTVAFLQAKGRGWEQRFGDAPGILTVVEL
jgi:hypothetical protein